jgi:hypothetical protein
MMGECKLVMVVFMAVIFCMLEPIALTGRILERLWPLAKGAVDVVMSI